MVSPDAQAMIDRLNDTDWDAFFEALRSRPDAAPLVAGQVNAIRLAMGADAALSEVEIRSRIRAVCCWSVGAASIDAVPFGDDVWAEWVPFLGALLVDVLGVPVRRLTERE